jgi:hypothetical protein
MQMAVQWLWLRALQLRLCEAAPAADHVLSYSCLEQYR